MAALLRHLSQDLVDGEFSGSACLSFFFSSFLSLSFFPDSSNFPEASPAALKCGLISEFDPGSVSLRRSGFSSLRLRGRTRPPLFRLIEGTFVTREL